MTAIQTTAPPLCRKTSSLINRIFSQIWDVVYLSTTAFAAMESSDERASSQDMLQTGKMCIGEMVWFVTV